MPLEKVPPGSFKLYPVKKKMNITKFAREQEVPENPSSGFWYNQFTTSEIIERRKQVILQDKVR